jgi:tetratricopeptide (TPR) repeat protein
MKASWVDRNIAVAAVLALLVAASYVNSLFNPFMWDDKQMILYNEGIRQGWTSVVNAFDPARWAGRTDDAGFTSFFRPMHTLLSILDYEIWGLNPFGFHLSNALVHLFNTLFLFFLALRLTGQRLASFAAASIFAVHPVHTESVTFISARVDLLAAAFMMTSFYFYMKAGKGLFSWRYAASLVLFWLAMFSKEMAVMLPVLLSVYSWIYEERGGRVKKAGPFFVLLGAYIAYRIFGLETFAGEQQLRAGVVMLVSTAAAATFDYVRLLVFPYPLKAYYTLTWYGPGSLKALAGFAVLISAALLFILLYMSRRKAAAFTLAWTFIALAPVMNIGSLGEFSIAERYLYIPSIGFSVFAGLCFANFMKGGYGKGAITALAVIVIVFGAMTMSRNRLWSNDLDFYTEMVRVAPSSAAAHGNLGHAHFRLGALDAAVKEMEAASSLVPGNPDIAYELGTYYYKAGRFDEAAGALERAVRGRPGKEDAWNLLGISYAETGRNDAAVEAFTRAVELNPSSQAASNLKRIQGM